MAPSRVVRKGIYSEKNTYKRHRCYNTKGNNSIYIIIYIFPLVLKNIAILQIQMVLQIPNENWTSCQNIWPTTEVTDL